MEKRGLTNIFLVFFFSLMMALSFSASALDESSFDKHANHSHGKNNPDNLIKAMTFISTRPFNSVDGTFFLDGLFGGDGMGFFKNVLGLTDQQIEQKRNAAIAFYASRFGIDVNNPKVYFTGFQIDPGADYRVIMMTGEENPGKGYPIIDGGFAVAVTDPAGLDLGGEFMGTHVPAGTVFAAEGTYVIKRGKERKDIVINYQSRGPMQPVGTGGVINCEVVHPVWGKGLGWGYFEFHNLKNGQITSQVRNVLTFPGLGIEETMIQK
ncbi:hypothetical protein MGMO_177c00050 [Methyloglobulus morosus KoM1]|uniref:Uncharacterized protein n=1 Tax=Methyloglobulus morosus KoM1 TaxID=1116472 RepID=V5BG49_9GAMM|nr:hypothetical protein [Methyloglobulus morosus]ESS66714.1 hypothetical protein MGMO_177c00050 [Methyloglobulus morosus KoM1]